MATAPVIPGPGQTINVADVLGVGSSYGAMDLLEFGSVLIQASSNSQILANPMAKAMLVPVGILTAVYGALKIGELIFVIVKPIVKMIMNIVGTVFNPANVGELVQDIIMIILQIIMTILPIIFGMIKKLFMTIPIATGAMTTEQLAGLQARAEAARQEARKIFASKIKAANTSIATERGAARAETISELGGGTPITDVVDPEGDPAENLLLAVEQLKTAIIEDAIEEIMSIELAPTDEFSFDNLDAQAKLNVKRLINGILDAVKKMEIAKAMAIIEKNFTIGSVGIYDDPVQLEAYLDALAAKIHNANDFYNVLRKEIEKMKKNALAASEIFEAIDSAKDLVMASKDNFIDDIINSLDDIKIDEFPIDTCAEIGLTNSFDALKDHVYNREELYIDTTTIIDFEDFVTFVVNDAKSEVDNHAIVIDPACQTNYGKSICDSITDFKNALYAETKIKINASSIKLTADAVPSNINPYEYKRTVNYIVDGVKDGLIKQAYKIIIDGKLPCKACRPCNEMIADLDVYISNQIAKSKLAIKNLIDSKVNAVVWTGDINNRKQQLKDALREGIYNVSGEIKIIDAFNKKIDLEKKYLIKNVKDALRLA